MAQVRGHVDGVEEGCVVGWAVAPGSDGNCRITVVDEAGEVVLRGRASRSRSDLAVLNFGRINVAFRLPGLDLDRPGTYRVLADDVELPNSPVIVAPDLFDGQIELRDGTVSGWVRARAMSFAPPHIQVRDQDGLVVAEGSANAPDAEGAPASFRLPVVDACFGRPEVRLHVFANGIEFRALQCDLRLVGNTEVLSAERIEGWLFAPAAPKRRFEITVAIDGVAVGVAVCKIRREDVRVEHPSAIAPGFTFDIPARSRPAKGRLAVVTLSLGESGALLFGGPAVMGERAPAIQAAHRIAQLGLAGALDKTDAAVLRDMVQTYLQRLRGTSDFAGPVYRPAATGEGIRINIIVPIYRDVAVTRACIETVLAEKSPRDRVVLVNDASPEPGMDEMLRGFAQRPDVVLLTNENNRGFVGSANRGLAFCCRGDLLLLNSDTRLFNGCLDELHAVAHTTPSIGTVTPLSSNATFFTYPHPDLRFNWLDDVSWERLAAVTLDANRGCSVDVPTGHGFCLFIKRGALDTVGLLDESFGRGYGEENDFCVRAADRGFRNVCATGVLVQHLESISFIGDKLPLLRANLAILHRRYPEYQAIVMAAEARDVLRQARWPLDRARLSAAADDGVRFVLVVQHFYGGGTKRAIDDIDAIVGFAGRRTLALVCVENGLFVLSCDQPAFKATFAKGDEGDLFRILRGLPLDLVVVHQFLGYSAEMIAGFGELASDIRTIYYAHDFYSICPRITMIDALGEFCDVADAARCLRCVEMDGAHPASRLDGLVPAEHRALFANALGRFHRVVSPSESGASYLRRAFEGLDVLALPHPEKARDRIDTAGTALEHIVVIGAISRQKGSSKLHEIVTRARLTHPSLHFYLIGYTDDDERFDGLPNISITGRYGSEQLTQCIERSDGRIALFLNVWPETFSYTLSEAVRHGLLPVVPNLGAPAERVRSSGFGVVYSYPFSASTVLNTLDRIIAEPSRYFVQERAADIFSDEGKRISQTTCIYGLKNTQRTI